MLLHTHSFNVGGNTIHRVFQLPIEHEGKSATYWSLPKASQKVMRTTLRNVKFMYVDEVSMVSSLNLAYMHLRLEEVFGTNEWFGSKICSLLVIFSNYHLSMEIMSLRRLPKNPCHSNWDVQHLSTFGKILLSMRNSLLMNDRKKMLDCVRRGCPTDETLRTLEQRVINVPVADKFHELQKSGHMPVCLFPTRKACNEFNAQMVNYLPSEIHQLVCTDETAGSYT